jgi:hypothetical protein
MNTYNTAEYTINVVDNNANNHYASKALIVHNTNSAYITEWAQITTNNAIGTFSASSNTGSAILNFTPISSNTVVSFARIEI